MAEPADVSPETLRLMSIAGAVHGALAALGVAIAYYVYFYIPHSDEIHYAGKYGEVVASAATYIFVFPVFQVWAFVLSVIGRRGATRPHPLDNLTLGKRFPQPATKEQACRVASFVIVVMHLIILGATVYRAMVGRHPNRLRGSAKNCNAGQ